MGLCDGGFDGFNVVYSRKTSKRLIKDRTEELQSYFELIDYDKAKETLASDNIIKDGYLIVDDEADPFDTKSEIKLDDCRIEFFCKTRSGAYIYALVFFAKADNVFLTTVELDKNSYTFFRAMLGLSKTAIYSSCLCKTGKSL